MYKLLQSSRTYISFRMPTTFGPRQAHRLTYNSYGEPSEVISLESDDLPELKPTQIRLQWKAAPVNPADVNQLQGVYPVKPKLPAVGGNEGCAVVKEVSQNVVVVSIVLDWIFCKVTKAWRSCCSISVRTGDLANGISSRRIRSLPSEQ